MIISFGFGVKKSQDPLMNLTPNFHLAISS
jgi:hypothetical protein